MKNKNALREEIRNLKLGQEAQSILLCETTELRKKVEEDRAMIEDEKILLSNRLEEKTSDVQNLANIQFDTMNQLMIANKEFNRKDIKITTLETQNILL